MQQPTFKQFLTEVFDKGFEWEWSEEFSVGDTTTYAFFNTPDNSMAVKFSRIGSKYEVGFGPYEIEESKRGDQVRKRILLDTTSALNTSYSSKIIATVIDVIRNFVNKYDPQKLTFTAEKGNIGRAEFYQKVLKRELPNGYTVQIDDAMGNVAFLIKKEQ